MNRKPKARAAIRNPAKRCGHLDLTFDNHSPWCYNLFTSQLKLSERDAFRQPRSSREATKVLSALMCPGSRGNFLFSLCTKPASALQSHLFHKPDTNAIRASDHLRTITSQLRLGDEVDSQVLLSRCLRMDTRRPAHTRDAGCASRKDTGT